MSGALPSRYHNTAESLLKVDRPVVSPYSWLNAVSRSSATFGGEICFTIAKRWRRMFMVITVVWETWLKAGTEAEGLRLTRRIWLDMRGFNGYISHQLLVDQDEPRHIIVLGRWQSRDDADRVLDQYKDAETVRLLTPLLARPRNRWVTVDIDQV
jgi:hypothetical protein